MPSKSGSINSLDLHQCQQGLKYENFRQAHFERIGNRQRALEANRNATELFSRLQWLAQSEAEQEAVG